MAGGAGETPAAPSLRSALPGDADALAHVRHRAWLETYADVVPASFWDLFTLESNRDTWRRWLDEGIDVTLAEVDGAVVGFAIAAEAAAHGGHEPVRDLQLYSLYVIAAKHGTGVGQRLLDSVVAPATPAQLWVAERNPRARRFYERNGFLPDGAAFTDEPTGIAEIRLVR